MSRKRSSKEKLPVEEQAVTDESDQALVSTRAPLTKVSGFMLYSDHFRYVSGVARAPPHVCVPSLTAAQKQWREQVARTLPSPLLYPSHTVTVAMHPSLALPPTQYDGIALTVLSVLDVHRCACAWRTPTTTEPQTPLSGQRASVDVVQLLVGHSVTAQGYSGPEEERKDTTFTGGVAAAAASTDAPPTLAVTGHYSSTHINVCCGHYYYKLEVLDTAQATLRSRAALSRDLAAIARDAQEREATAPYHRHVAPDVAQDLRGMYELLARMSAIGDDVAADIHRRLRQEGDVNTYSLSALQAALFTVVLDAPNAADARVKQSQWLHSGLSLYFDPNVRGAFSLRVHGVLADGNSARVLGESVAARVFKSMTLPLLVEPLSGAVDTTSEPMQLSRRVGQRAEALELWLPEKHRMALRPFAGLSRAPRWAAAPALMSGGHAAHTLLSLLMACEAALFDRGEQRRPRVCLVVQDVATRVPRAIPLYTESTEAFLQQAHAPQAMSVRDSWQHLRDAGLNSLHELLASAGEGIGPESDEATFSGLPDMDICVAAQLLPWVPADTTARYQVTRCRSFIGAPARLFISCTVQQTRVQKAPRLGDGRVMAVEVGSVYGEEAFSDAVATNAAAFLASLVVV